MADEAGGKFSRREFLKLAGLVLASEVVAACDVSKKFPGFQAQMDGTIPKIESLGAIQGNEVKNFLPQIVDGVEVYGLNEEIKTMQDFQALDLKFDAEFEKKLTPEQRTMDRWEQREAVLPVDRRLLEIVVQRSAYDAFVSNSDGNGAKTLAEWMKMHVEAANLVLKHAKPPSPISIDLLRLIVLDDSFTSNPNKISRDFDASWFLNVDYINEEGQLGFVRNFHPTESGEICFESGLNDGNKEFVHPPEAPSLVGRKGKLDWGLIHEMISHHSLNLVDEYPQNVILGEKNNLQKKLLIDTGNFQEPTISPYLVFLIRRNFERKVRGYYTHPEGLGMTKNTLKEQPLSERPKKVNLSFNLAGEKLNGEVSISRIRLEGDSYSKKTIPEYPDQIVNGGSVAMYDSLFEPTKRLNPDNHQEYIYPTDWLIKVKTSDGREKQLFMPVAPFNMSGIARVEEANYEISFLNSDYEDGDTQVMRYVNKDDMVNLPPEPIYATMKIEGTDTFCIWFYRKNK